MLLFFFFKQKTAYEMRISDWSSDVCSSDLQREAASSGRGDRRFHMGISLRDAIRRPASAAPGTEHCALRRRGSHDYARRSASLYRRPHWEAAVAGPRSEEHTSELQSLMRSSYAVFCLKTTKINVRANTR